MITLYNNTYLHLVPMFRMSGAKPPLALDAFRACTRTTFDFFSPCFFLSCNANARVKPAKTGHGPHSFNSCVVLCIFCVVLCIFVLFYILFVLCRSVYFCAVLCIVCFVLFYVFLCCSVCFCVVLRIFVLFYVLFVLCRSVYCLCVYVYCTTATGWLPNCS